MNYVESLNLFGVEAKEIPCIKGSGAPTESTVGAVGLLYMDTDTGDIYKCTAENDGVYTWRIISPCVNEVSYYNDLSTAISDINNDSFDNRLVDTTNAKVKVTRDNIGKVSVMLIDDVSESVKIDINKDINLVLNGKTLSFISAGAYLNFGKDIRCIIDGEIVGSTINKNVASVNALCYLFNIDCESLYVRGGTYEMNVDNTSHTLVFRGTTYNKVIDICKCDIRLVNANVAVSGNNIATRAVQTYAEKCTIDKTNIYVMSYSFSDGVWSAGHLAISDSMLDVNSNGEQSEDKAYGVTNSTNSKKCTIDKTNIYVMSRTTSMGVWNESYLAISDSILDVNSSGEQSEDDAYGIYAVDGVIHLDNTRILADNPNCHVGSSFSIGISGGIDSKLFVNNSTVFGTHSGISAGGQLYINGGTYTGYCHGGIYFSNGQNGVSYVNDAELRCGNYEGAYDYSNKISEAYGCLYIGGETQDQGNNMTIYIDGCIIGDGGGNAIVLRGSSGEQNNTVNISNSTLTSSAGVIRIDNDTHRLNVGVGTNIVQTGSNIVYTDKLYRKNHADKVCNGNDYNALIEYVESKSVATALRNAEEVFY